MEGIRVEATKLELLQPKWEVVVVGCVSGGVRNLIAGYFFPLARHVLICCFSVNILFNFPFTQYVASASPFVSLLSHSSKQKKEIQTPNQNRS